MNATSRLPELPVSLISMREHLEPDGLVLLTHDVVEFIRRACISVTIEREKWGGWPTITGQRVLHWVDRTSPRKKIGANWQCIGDMEWEELPQVVQADFRQIVAQAFNIEIRYLLGKQWTPLRRNPS